MRLSAAEPGVKALLWQRVDFRTAPGLALAYTRIQNVLRQCSPYQHAKPTAKIKSSSAPSREAKAWLAAGVSCAQH